MKNTYLRDCKDNMIFEQDVLEDLKSGDLYKVFFSYYTHMDSEHEAYGFWLLGSGDNRGVYPMPRCDEGCKIKLFNASRGEK